MASKFALEESLKMLFKYSTSGMAILSKERKFVAANKAFCKMLGYNQKELKELDCTKLTHEEDICLMQQNIEYLIKGKKRTVTFEKRCIHKSNKMIWTKLNLTTISDKTAQPDLVFIEIQDISKQKEAEEKLVSSEEKFDLALKGSSVGLWDWDMKTGEIFCADKIIEILNVKKRQNFQLFFSEFEDRLHPKDYPLVKKAIETHLKHRAPYDIEYRLRRFDDQYIWIHAKGQAIWDEQNNPIRMAGSVEDITEKKNIADKLEAEESTRETIVDSTYDGYWDWHIKDDYEYMSPRYWEIFGYKPAEKKHHPSEWQKVLTPESLKKGFEHIEKHFKSKGKIPFSVELECTHKNGSIVHILSRGKVIQWDKDGSPLRMVGTHTDLTGLRNAQKKLEEYAQKLEKSNEDLDYFAYIVSHDLKEPVRSISNNVLFLEQDYLGKLDEGAKKRLGRISYLCEKMSQMINDLFHFSRLKNQELSVSNTDIHAIVLEVQSTIDEPGTVFKISDKLPNIICDHVMIKELFRNLIGNAIKYNDKEKKLIEIGFKKKYKSKENVFFVKDNGLGIDEKHFEDIFQIFKRLEHRNEEGTGFGLAFVKKVVEDHNGEIWLESEANKGTCFFFTINMS